MISFLKDFRALVRAYMLFIFVFVLHRAVFWSLFKDTSQDSSLASFFKAWWIGFRFDLRLITIFFLLCAVLFLILRFILSFFYGLDRIFLKLQSLILTLGMGAFIILLWLDFANYSYLAERVSSKLFALITSPDIAFQMITQSYPLYVIIPSFLVFIILIFLIIDRNVFQGESQNAFFSLRRTYNIHSSYLFFLVFFVMAFFIHSKVSQYPLRWSEAYFSKSNFINQFALSPAQNILDTYKFSKKIYGSDELVQEFKEVRADLGIISEEEKEQVSSLIRSQEILPVFDQKMNVVVIMMESLAAFKMGSFGSPFETTPYFDGLVNEGLLFDNFHVIQTGTAASVFCFLSGIPDLNEEETASRNPLVVDQHTMINNFKSYKKNYFIGGDANWGNIRGVIKNNIEDVHLFEEKDFKLRGRNDVWGISDLDLFKEAHKILESQSDTLSFTFIQTAGYHRPYTIPDETDGFEIKSLTEKQIKDYGFENNEEYNSLRFSDHALGQFMKRAKESSYFDKTVFVIYADHGLRSYDQVQLSDFYKNHRFPLYHIPFLIYAKNLPQELKGTKNSTLGFEPDILPTLQSFIGAVGPNSTFGLDLRSEQAQQRKGVFLKGLGALPVVFFDGTHFINTAPDKESEIVIYKTENFVEQLYALKNNKSFKNEKIQLNDELQEKAQLGRAYYKTIKYMLRNNQKSKVLSE